MIGLEGLAGWLAGWTGGIGVVGLGWPGWMDRERVGVKRSAVSVGEAGWLEEVGAYSVHGVVVGRGGCETSSVRCKGSTQAYVISGILPVVHLRNSMLDVGDWRSRVR